MPCIKGDVCAKHLILSVCSASTPGPGSCPFSRRAMLVSACKIRTAIFPLGNVIQPLKTYSTPGLSNFNYWCWQICCSQEMAPSIIGSFECCRNVRIQPIAPAEAYPSDHINVLLSLDPSSMGSGGTIWNVWNFEKIKSLMTSKLRPQTRRRGVQINSR